MKKGRRSAPLAIARRVHFGRRPSRLASRSADRCERRAGSVRYARRLPAGARGLQAARL